MSNRSGGDAPLTLASSRAARELLSLQSRFDLIEQALGEALRDPARGGAHLGALQEIDMVRQTVVTLADFLLDVTEQYEKKGHFNLHQTAEKVPLRALGARLSGGGESSEDHGVELF